MTQQLLDPATRGGAAKQSFAWWSFTWRQEVEPDALLRAAADIGYRGVEMLPEKLWGLARDCGLELVTMKAHEDVDVGFNDRASHKHLRAAVDAALEKAASGRVKNLIVFAGRRGAIDDDEAADVCAEGLAPLTDASADAGIPLLLELLNSIEHPGYQADRTEWGRRVVDSVASPSLRLLYDAYHMQIMEGNVVSTIKSNLEAIAHVHTAGVPGRRDIDDTQELNYRAIFHRLAAYGYNGYVGHEFIPRGDPIVALRSAHKVCAEAMGAASTREARGTAGRR